jgi:hypothetical protein
VKSITRVGILEIAADATLESAEVPAIFIALTTLLSGSELSVKIEMA